MLLSMCFMSSRAGSTWQNARSATSRGGEAGALDGGVDALGMGGEEVLAERRVGRGLPAGGGLARYLPGRVGADGPAVLPRPLT